MNGEVTTSYFYEKENENHELSTGFFVHKRIMSTVTRVESVSDSMSYIILKGHLVSYHCSKRSCPQKRIKLMK
jgi:hypothetical protein